MRRNSSFTTSKIFGNQTVISKGDFNQSKRKPESIRQSQRKPIFDKSVYYSTVANYAVKRPLSFNQQTLKIKQTTHDDFCGCEHNLDVCPHVQALIKGTNQAAMRKEYDEIDSLTQKISKMQIKRKYLKFLPPHYPELYHAQLTNVLSNMGRDISFNQFLALASIEYHAKLEHLTYFLFNDLDQSLNNKTKFLKNLQTQLIKYEVNYYELIQQSRVNNVPLQAFFSDYYESAGAIVVPLSRYAVFLKLLLKQGSLIKLKLLVYLIVRKRQSLTRLVHCYARSIPYLRQQSRELPWEMFLEDLKQ